MGGAKYGTEDEPIARHWPSAAATDHVNAVRNLLRHEVLRDEKTNDGVQARVSCDSVDFFFDESRLIKLTERIKH